MPFGQINLDATHPAIRAAILGAGLVLCACLMYLIVGDFVVGALTDERILVSSEASTASFITAPFTEERIGVHPDLLSAAIQYFPSSPRLHMRLAEFESRDSKKQLSAAAFHAQRATELSPHDYRPHLILASIQDSQGEAQASQESLFAALRLAPSNLEAHWDLAVLLQNEGRLRESYEHFRMAASGHPAYFKAAIDLVWAASGQNVEAAESVTPDNAEDKLELATFLLEKSRFSESSAIFQEIHRETLLKDPEAAHYLNTLIAAGQIALAHDLWSGLVDAGPGTTEDEAQLIWNGGFESDIFLDFAQFHWSITPTNYARISIDGSTLANGGSRSLRIDFAGRDTTRLEKEIKHLVLVRPGAHYQLHYAVKTQELTLPEGPRVVVMAAQSRDDRIATSGAVQQGSSGWTHQTVEFTAPTSAVVIAIQQYPKFSYEDPTHGTVWFDDFELREIRGK